MIYQSTCSKSVIISHLYDCLHINERWKYSNKLLMIKSIIQFNKYLLYNENRWKGKKEKRVFLI